MNNLAHPAKTKPILPGLKRQLYRIYSSTHLLIYSSTCPRPREPVLSLSKGTPGPRIQSISKSRFERGILPQMQGLGPRPAAGVLKYFEDRMRARNAADAQEVRSKIPVFVLLYMLQSHRRLPPPNSATPFTPLNPPF